MHHVPAAENRLSEVKNGFNQSGAPPPCRGLTHCRAGVWMHKGQSHTKAQKDKAPKAAALLPWHQHRLLITEWGGVTQEPQSREGQRGMDRDGRDGQG